MLDLYNRLSGVEAIRPQAARTASFNGTAVDLSALNNGANGVTFFIIAGAITDGTHAFKLQDSTDGGSTWVDVAAPYIQGSFTSATTAGKVIKLGYLGNPNPSATNATQVRVVANVSGATSGGFYSGIAVEGLFGSLPAA